MNPKKFRGWCRNNCGHEIKAGATKYCSFRCQHEYWHLQKVSRFLENGGHYGYVDTKFLGRVLRQLHGDKCSRCGWAERHSVTRRIPVEVEHIDGNWENNFLDNLTLLCPSCHALTPTFRGLNRGRGRAFRAGGRENPLRTGKSSQHLPEVVRFWEVNLVDQLQLNLL